MRKLNLHQGEKPTQTAQAAATTDKTQPKSILEAFERIVENVEDSRLDDSFFHKSAREIIYASRLLKLSPMQTVLLSIFVDRSEDSSILLSEIAKYDGLSLIHI